MKFSEQWLREWVNPAIDTQTLSLQLTMAGLEVEELCLAYSRLSEVVIAEVHSISDHPSNNKLKLCQLDIGEQKHVQVVCGATNVATNQFVALAKLGAVLPNNMKIDKREIGGVVSDGMLCSATDLGIPETSTGVMTFEGKYSLGSPISSLLGEEDHIITVSITPNRGDCLSVLGLAREVAAVNQLEITYPTLADVEPVHSDVCTVQLIEKEACPIYLGRIIRDVNCHQASPLWLQEKLRRSGIRSHSAVVDIGNYVMLELGQPLHIFDYDKLQGDIIVRTSEQGEKLKLINGEVHDLRADTLLIADQSGPLALAGIMGGISSAVTNDSRHIFLESAYFSPKAISGRARHYGLQTDASYRFERGVDPNLQRDAMERATVLLISLCGGKPGPIESVQASTIPYSRPIIHLKKADIFRCLGGLNQTDQQIQTMLESLNMRVNGEDTGWQVQAPSYRFDIQAQEDVIEEIARINGFDQLPRTKPKVSLTMRPVNSLRKKNKHCRIILSQRGYQEVVTFSFVAPDLQADLAHCDDKLDLMNPISPDFSQMRTSLWSGLVNVAAYNYRRQQNRVRIFEVGKVFSDGGISQRDYIGGISFGSLYGNQWGMPKRSMDLFDIKADVEALIKGGDFNVAVNYQEVEHHALLLGQAVSVIVDKNNAGLFGQLHPNISMKVGLPSPCYIFELDIKYLYELEEKQLVKTILPSKFPAIRRDLALVVDESIVVGELMEFILLNTSGYLINLELFDVFYGKMIDLGKKSLAIELTFQVTYRTLLDNEIQEIVDNLLKKLDMKFGVKLRS